jgi:hypothetical protein
VCKASISIIYIGFITKKLDVFLHKKVLTISMMENPVDNVLFQVRSLQESLIKSGLPPQLLQGIQKLLSN